MSASFDEAFTTEDPTAEIREIMATPRGDRFPNAGTIRRLLAEADRLTAERDQARNTAAVFEQRLAVLADLYSAAFAESNSGEVDDEDAAMRVINRAWCRLEYALGLGVLNSGDDEIAERLTEQAEAEGWFTDLAPLFRPQDES